MGWFTRTKEDEQVELDAAARASAEVKRVLAEKPVMEARVKELNEQIRPLALELAELKEAGIECAAQKEAVRQLKANRDAIRQKWEDDLRETRRVVETFTGPKIRTFKNWCVAENRRMRAEEKITQKVETGTSYATGATIFDVTNNIGALNAVSDILMQAIADVDRYQHDSAALDEFIKGVKARALNVDLRKCSQVELPGDLANEIDEKQKTGNLAQAFRFPDGGVIASETDKDGNVVGHVVDQHTEVKQLNDRIRVVKELVKGA